MGSAGSERVRVWCDGCFDLVHYGHANSLRQAKAMGDVLVVGVHSDADIRTCKGPPVFTQDERYAMVRAIKWVDEVVEGSTYWPDAQTLAHHNCAFATHGDDLSVTKDGKDPYQALKDLGKLKIYQRTLGVSTTDIVGRMLLLTKTHHASSHQPVDDNSPVHQVGVKAWAAGPGHPRISQFLPTAKKLAQFSDGKEPLPGDFVVYVSGDFDLLHPGHLAFLKAARAEGDYLIVGIHSDHIVNAKKGGNYPIMNLYERSLSLLACRYVDEVIIAAPYDVTPQLLDQMKVARFRLLWSWLDVWPGSGGLGVPRLHGRSAGSGGAGSLPRAQEFGEVQAAHHRQHPHHQSHRAKNYR